MTGFIQLVKNHEEPPRADFGHARHKQHSPAWKFKYFQTDIQIFAEFARGVMDDVACCLCRKTAGTCHPLSVGQPESKIGHVQQAPPRTSCRHELSSVPLHA